MNILKITKDNFEKEVLKNEKAVLLDFWASWCGPCRMLAPELEALAEKYGERLVIGKVNVDEEGNLADIHGIESIPTLVVYEKGKITKAAAGYRNFAALEEWLELK